MAGALFPRLKNWVSTEDVVYSDLNGEFDNVLNNFIPTMMDDYSANVSQMQVNTDPGEVGTESLATTLAGELARLRFIIKEITGETQWYASPTASLVGLANAIGTGLTDNRLVSGRVRGSGSDQPIFLVPHGAARTVTLKGATTNFIYYINGVSYTISTDVTLTSLTAAPSSNNTASVNDSTLAAATSTKYVGEDASELIISSVGSEITALVGKLAAFKIVHGGNTEYFLARVDTNKLTKVRRGYFFDSTDTPISRVAISNSDTITLMKLSWIFAKTDGTLAVVYTNPTWSKDQPTSPAIGDYWFDLANNTWKKYDSTTFVSADATLVGSCIQDATNTIGARSFEFFQNYSDMNSVELFYDSATVLKSRFPDAQINVWGATLKNEHNFFTWDITLDRDSGVSETSSTYYYFYITQTGDVVISDVKPYDRRADLRGYYHPHNSWRAVGWAFNNSGSDLSAVESYYRNYSSEPLSIPQTATFTAAVMDKRYPITAAGGSVVVNLPPIALARGQVLEFMRTDSTMANTVTLDGFAAETIGGNATRLMHTQYETWRIVPGDTEWIILSHYCATPDQSYTPTYTGFGTVSVTSAWWNRINNYLQVRVRFTAGTTTATEARLSFPASTTASANIATLEAVAPLFTTAGSTTSYEVYREASVAYFTFGRMDASNNGVTKKNGNNIATSGDVLSFTGVVPIVGWEP